MLRIILKKVNNVLRVLRNRVRYGVWFGKRDFAHFIDYTHDETCTGLDACDHCCYEGICSGKVPGSK